MCMRVLQRSYASYKASLRNISSCRRFTASTLSFLLLFSFSLMRLPVTMLRLVFRPPSESPASPSELLPLEEPEPEEEEEERRRLFLLLFFPFLLEECFCGVVGRGVAWCGRPWRGVVW